MNTNWFATSHCPLFLAPMAGFTGFAFRQLCKELGADVMLTEFVQAEPLLRDITKTWQTIDFNESQRPMGVQIFGAIPERMALAAQLLVERLKPDFIDLNFGCPAINVVEQNAGASLLRDIPLLLAIAGAVVRAVPGTPVTAKMRTGWDAASIVAVEVARRLEEIGVRTITVHGRTRAQGYSGEADWDEIARVARAVRIPVVGNGDIRDGATAARRFRESGVAGLMIGRAALSNPWLFGEIKAAFLGGEKKGAVGESDRWAMLDRYVEALARQNATEPGSDTDARWMLPRLYPLTHGLPGARQARSGLSACKTLEEIKSFMKSWPSGTSSAFVGT